jgi:replication factor C subunit 1
VSGTPGIGKSSAVKIIAKELGYNLLEMNASDNRSKKTIEGLLKDLITCTTISQY